MVKFTGNFKKLIPMGFKFHKLFARNYKVYNKNDVWIWVAHGGYIELKDLYDLSGYAIKMILDGTYPVYEEDVIFPSIPNRIMFKKGEPRSCRINEGGKIHSYHDFCKLHRSKFKTLEEFWDFERESGYRELLLKERHINTIKEIAHMIEITKE